MVHKRICGINMNISTAYRYLTRQNRSTKKKKKDEEQEHLVLSFSVSPFDSYLHANKKRFCRIGKRFSFPWKSTVNCQPGQLLFVIFVVDTDEPVSINKSFS